MIFLFEAPTVLACVISGDGSGARKRLKVPVRLPLGFNWLAPEYWICPFTCGELIRICKMPLFWVAVIFISCHTRSISMNFFA